MNRKEFTSLLLEWRKNFINERGASAIYHRNDPGKGFLINPSLREIEGLEDYMQAYIKKFNLSSLNDIANLRNFENGVVLPKTNEVIKMISNFFIEMSKSQEKSREILATANNNECVIIHFTEGDFTLDRDDQDKEEIYHWTIHDLEHSMLSMITPAEFYFSKAMLNSTKFGKEIISTYNVEKDKGLSIDMSEALNNSANLSSITSIVEEFGMLIDKFFKTIGFTTKVGLDDLNASVMSYCYIRMKNADDVEEILNLNQLNFTEEEKHQLIDVFRKYYYITQSSFNNLKEKLKDCIVIVFAL